MVELNKGYRNQSEEHELFSDITDDFVRDDFKDVETDSLAEGSALTDDDDVTFLDWKSWRAVNWDISVSFFVSIVFRNVVKVISSDNNSSLHFGWDHNTLEDSSSDGDVAGKGTFLIDVGGLDGFLGGSESEANVLEISDAWSGLFS